MGEADVPGLLVTDHQALDLRASQFDAVTICRIGVQSADGVDLPGAVVLNATTSTEFAKFWNRKVRR